MSLDDFQLADLAFKEWAVLVALACAVATGVCIMLYVAFRAALELFNDWRERRLKSSAYISAHALQLPKDATATSYVQDVSKSSSNRELANT